VQFAAEVLGDCTGGHGGLPGRVVQILLVGPVVLAVDLPLSAVADTLTLPTVYWRSASKRPAADPAGTE
jgi:uncharacterized protein YceK